MPIFGKKMQEGENQDVYGQQEYQRSDIKE